MAKVMLKAELRSEITKQSRKKIRREGNIPAVVYASGKESSAVQISSYDFGKLAHGEHGASLESVIVDLEVNDGSKSSTRHTIIKEIQQDPIKGKVLHIDFNEISMTQKIHTHVPVIAVGESLGEKLGGIREQVLREIEVACLPADMPESIKINIEELDIGHSIHISDLDLGEKVEILNAPKQTVLTVLAPRKIEEEEEEEVAEGIEEPEVIGEKAEEEEKEGE
jgi:large subunit ribosomal protein L25